MSANMYRTREGRYYHIHGSLEASTTLNMIGLPSHRPDLTDYDEIIKVSSFYKAYLGYGQRRRNIHGP